LDDNTEVQLQILTAVVKLFLKRPKDTQEMVSKVLNLASQESDNPDLRDRGYLYWRLLSTDPEAAKAVVLGQQPLISGAASGLDENTLQELIGNLSTLASVYHKTPESFVKKIAKRAARESRKEDEEDPREKELERNNTPFIDIDSPSATPTPTAKVAVSSSKNFLDDLDFLSTPSPVVSQGSPKEIVVTADKGYGLQVGAAFVRNNGQITLELSLNNQSSSPINQIALLFNKNTFGLAPGAVQLTSPSILSRQTAEANSIISLNPNQISQGAPASNIIQTALKAAFQGLGDKVLYFQIPIQLHVLFIENGKLDRGEYLDIWKQIQEEQYRDINLGLGLNADSITSRFESNRLFFIARRAVQQQEFLYFSAKLQLGAVLLLELSLGPGGTKACAKTRSDLVQPFLQSVQNLLE